MGKLAVLSKYIKIIVFAIAVISIGIFIGHTDFADLNNQLEQIGFKFVYILLLTATAYLLGTIGWQICLGTRKQNITLLQLFAIRQVGETLALYNPGSIVTGDLLKAKLLQSYQIENDIALKSVATSRITATLSQISLFILSMLWLLASTSSNIQFQELEYVITFTIALLLLLKVALFVWLSMPIKKNYFPKKDSFWEKTKSSIYMTSSDTKTFFQKEKKAFWYSYLFFTLHWFVGSMEFYLLLSFMEYPIQIMHGLVLDMTVIVVKSIGAFIPGQLGIEELANKIVLNMIGVTGTSLWISISLLRRLRQVFWIVIGIVFSLYLKSTIKYQPQ